MIWTEPVARLMMQRLDGGDRDDMPSHPRLSCASAPAWPLPPEAARFVDRRTKRLSPRWLFDKAGRPRAWLRKAIEVQPPVDPFLVFTPYRVTVPSHRLLANWDAAMAFMHRSVGAPWFLWTSPAGEIVAFVALADAIAFQLFSAGLPDHENR